MLEITKQVDNTNVVLALEGRLDTMTAPQLQAEIDGAAGGATLLTLDLEKLEYISSAGLRVLLAAQKMMGGQGTMKILHVQESVMDIFDVTGFTDILTIE